MTTRKLMLGFLPTMFLLTLPALVVAQTDSHKDKDKDKKPAQTAPAPAPAPTPAPAARPARPTPPPAQQATPQPQGHGNERPSDGGPRNRTRPPSETGNTTTPQQPPNDGGIRRARPQAGTGTPGEVTPGVRRAIDTRQPDGIMNPRPTNNTGTPGGNVPSGRRSNDTRQPDGIMTPRPQGDNRTPGGAVGGTRQPNDVRSSRHVPPAPPAPTYRPPGNAQATRHTDGTQTYVDSRTRTSIHTDQDGRIRSIERPGYKASGFRPDGRAANIERARTDGSKVIVHRTQVGDRRVEMVRPDHVRVVQEGRRAFVERPLRTGYVSRTTIINGRSQVRVYQARRYGRVEYTVYVPPVRYQPAFYVWAASPWRTRVVYSWNYAPNTPWFYGGYFAPEPYYSAPALWLTDYVLAINLQRAYQDQQLRYQDAPPPPDAYAQNPDVQLTPEIKMQIAEEVRRQILEASAQQQQPDPGQPLGQPAGQPDAYNQQPSDSANVPPPALKQRVFVVSASLDVSDPGGSQTCPLSPGDIIERTPGQSVTSDGMVPVNVMSSKAGDCPADFVTQIDLGTLQEWQNQFREQLVVGMQSLGNDQGKTLPSGPPAGTTINADGRPPQDLGNDPQAQELIASLSQEADQTEAEMRNAAAGR